MGLRARGLVWVLGLSLALGSGGLALLTSLLRQSLESLELQTLRQDAERLSKALALQIEERQRAAREWSNWTDLRDFALQPQGNSFAAGNLTPSSLQSSGLGWLVLIDPQGKEILRRTAGVTPPSQPSDLRARAGCGLVRSAGELVAVCRLPILDSAGQGRPAGTLISGERIDERSQLSLRLILGLDFALLPVDGSQDVRGGEPMPGMAGATLQRGEQQHVLTWPLADDGGTVHSLLRLRWERELREPSRRLLAAAQAVLAGLAVLLALASFALIDWGLVRRLARLRDQMRALRVGEQWQGRLQVQGHDELSELALEGNHLLERIDRQMRALAAQSRTDALTELLNRRGVEERLQQALGRQSRLGLPLVLAMIDVDHFKRFNDLHGHAAGDAALRVLGEVLQDTARRGTDTAGRWGGEEFVVFFEGLDASGASLVMEKLRGRLRERPSGPDQPLKEPLRVSIGLALACADDTPTSLMQRADEALYRAKAEGRDRVVWADPPPTVPPGS